MKTFNKKISLDVKCPLCRESLMDSNFLIKEKPSIKLNIEKDNKRGTIRLCSIYGCYDHQTDIPLKKEEIISLYCPHCNQNITGKEVCDDCEAPMVPFVIATGGKVSVCTRNGCENHYIAFEDINAALRKFYDSYEK